MNSMSGRILLLLTITALGLVSPAPIRGWQMDDLMLERVPVPSDLRLVAAETSADLDGDGVSETLDLTQQRAVIKTGSQMRWQSPGTWQVKQALIADLNHDEFPEAVLLVWRPFRPWPVDQWLPHSGRIDSFHDSRNMSCHMILIGWKQDAFREIWAGSALADPVNRFAAVDLMGSGQQYLITLEGQYDDPPAAPAKRLKVWEWNGFGFTIVTELEDAHAYSVLGTAQTNDRQVLILTP
jgi:hypothetical protein